jgi:endonuclease/exonuclease/phosphatase (EEP) superfamily protein YafD
VRSENPTTKTHPKARRRSRLNTVLTAALLLAAAAPAALALAGIWPARTRPFHVDRAAHFLVYAAPALVICALLALPLRRRWLAAALFLGAVAAAIVPILAGNASRTLLAPPADIAERSRIRVVTFNAHAAATLRDRPLVDWLLAQNADLITVVDAPGGLFTMFPDLAAEFPHRVEPRRGRFWPILLLSRHELRIVRLTPTDEDSRSSYVANSTARVTLENGSTLLFTAMHPFSPRTTKAWKRSIQIVRRDGEILRAAQQRYNDPIIVAGDFNSTPVGRTFQEFAAASGFHTAAWPLPATWPADMPRLLGVAIDHIWVSPGIDILARRVGPSFRSDHRPVVMDVLLPDAPSRRDDQPEPARAP